MMTCFSLRPLRTALALGLVWGTAQVAAPRVAAQTFAKGADVGWLQQMEATGYVFHNEQGAVQDCFSILKAQGINSIRLRVFVNPSDDKASGHCSPAEVVAMAKRATDLGFRVMIDFHYSDTWADPGKQAKPAAWASHPFPQLLTDVYDHTLSTMQALKASGVTPEWVQVGNEIPGGMLWPEGSTQNFGQLAQLITKGYEAVKAVSPTSKVIVHLDRGNDSALYRDFFDKLTSNGGKFDVIGMSYYPYWLKQDYTASIANLGANLRDMVSRYPGKEVVVAEVGGDYTAVQNTFDMLVAVQQAVRAVPQHKGLGVFYWEPEGAKSWSGYQLSAWGDDGRPSPALKAFLADTKGQPARPVKAASPRRSAPAKAAARPPGTK
jgi:arabinogalactan endo-1,4-beta-galactosidase